MNVIRPAASLTGIPVSNNSDITEPDAVSHSQAIRKRPAHVNDRAMDTYHRWMEVVVPATMAGLPALSVPAGFSASGLPAGLQILGPTQADWSVLQLGHAYDQASGHARVRSPLLA